MPYIVEGYLEDQPTDSSNDYVVEGYQEPSFREKYGFKGMGLKKPLSVAKAGIKGIIEGAQNLNPLSPSGPVSIKMGRRAADEILPDEGEIEERLAHRVGKLAPLVALGPEELLLKGTQLGGGALLGQLAEEGGLGEGGQAIAEVAGMGAPGILQGVKQAAGKVTKAPGEKFASGLTKPRAVEGKLVKAATLSSSGQEQALKSINDEAAQLAKTAVQTHLPKAKDIEAGFDFNKDFEQRFANLEKSAKKANPDLDLTPITNFMQKNLAKVRGIPSPSSQEKKIMNEVKAWYSKTPQGLSRNLKVYRSNNRKLTEIFEKSRLTGKQQQYADFLIGQNKAIAESFEKTFPKGSAWVEQFKQLNKDFKGYKDAQSVMNHLDRVLRGESTPQKLRDLANNLKTQKRLALSMGDKGAQEIIQIAKDTDAARSAIKKIPVHDLEKYTKAFPLPLLALGAVIPGLGKATTTAAALPYLRRGYGWFLAKPARRAALSDALKSLASNDLNSYRKAAQVLLRESENEED